MDAIKKYDIVFKDVGYRSKEASMGLHFVEKLCNDYKFQSVLDVGCGPGWSVIDFLRRGKEAQGIEPCKYLFTQELRVPAGLGIVKEAQIISIPYPVDSFDLVFCTDVLEHVQEKDIKKAISELIRVSKKYVFCTSCVTEANMFPALKLHQTVKPVSWWKEQFEGFKIRKAELGVTRGVEFWVMLMV